MAVSTAFILAGGLWVLFGVETSAGHPIVAMDPGNTIAVGPPCC